MVTTCDLYDQYPEQMEVCELPFISYGRRNACYGQIMTVRCYLDNSEVKRLLTETNGSGKVLVVDAGGAKSHAMLGDLIATQAVANHWHGIIINGAVRDIGELATLDLHIKALSSIPRKTNRQNQGICGLPVRFGNAHFIPGQWLYSDHEGLVACSENIDIAQ